MNGFSSLSNSNGVLHFDVKQEADEIKSRSAYS